MPTGILLADKTRNPPAPNQITKDAGESRNRFNCFGGCPKTGLTVRCELDTRDYPKGIKVSDADMATLNIKGDEFLPEWNYTISPRVAT